MTKKSFSCIALNALFICIGYTVLAQELPKVTNVFHIASAGTWDFITVCPANNNLYVSHGTQVNIIDKTTGDSIGVIPNTTGIHGVAFYLPAAKGYTSNGKLNNVTVFDLKTNDVLKQIATGEKPDVIFFEPFSKTIITCNGLSNSLSLIDPANDKVVATIALGGKPEAAVADGEGKVYVNIEDKNEIAVVDMKLKRVIKHWALAPGEAPAGLAIDKKTKRLFAGCENKQLVIMDGTNGKVISHFPIGSDCDGVVFNNKTKMIYAANGENGTISVIKEQTDAKFKFMGTIPTKKGARTLCIDEADNTLYLPTADLEKTIASGAKRPAMLPGTFQVLVLK